MSKKEKLIMRLLLKPKDFTFDEMSTLLSFFGYELKQGGTGSGVKFSELLRLIEVGASCFNHYCANYDVT